MNELGILGYKVEAILGREHLDVTLIATSPERAISRTRGTLTHNRRNLGWLHAEYTVVETMSFDEFKARRADGRT